MALSRISHFLFVMDLYMFPIEGAKKFEDVGELAEQVTFEQDKTKFAVRQTATEV